MATPPTPTARPVTPPAPRYGTYYDNWEPFQPRKSARISSQNNRLRTPSPSSHRISLPAQQHIVDAESQDMESPSRSPRKKQAARPDTVRRAAVGVNSDMPPTSPHQNQSRVTMTRQRGMLPTPSKTPSKPPTEKTAANIRSIARNLFNTDEDAMPSPRKRRSKTYSGMTLDSFTAEDAEEDIDIFADSQDRIPTRDNSALNPFNGKKSVPTEPAKRRSKRKVYVPGEGARLVDEVVNRDDGMVCVFRGKKVFRRFADVGDEDVEDEVGESEGVLNTHFTRSSLKPRLLFQPQKTQEMIDEEEASTDIEEAEEPVHCPSTPSKNPVEKIETPDAPRFAPMSPPDTKRTTRSTNKLFSNVPTGKTGGRRSPFDSWARTKEQKPTGTKRAAESLGSTPTKRARI